MYILDLVYVSIIFGVYTVHIQQRNSVQPLCFLCVFFGSHLDPIGQELFKILDL